MPGRRWVLLPVLGRQMLLARSGPKPRKTASRRRACLGVAASFLPIFCTCLIFGPAFFPPGCGFQSPSLRKRPKLDHAAIQEKRLALIKNLPPGDPVPYMDGKGAVYKDKMPVARADALPAPKLPDMVRVFAHGVGRPKWRRYVLAPDAASCDVILVKDLASALYEEIGLLARLHGCRLADETWALTKMRGGKCIAFASALSMHLYFYVQESFREAHPGHAAILERASGSRAKGLQVKRGPLPDKPAHPRLSYELAFSNPAEGSQVLTLMGMLEKITCVRV